MDIQKTRTLINQPIKKALTATRASQSTFTYPLLFLLSFILFVCPRFTVYLPHAPYSQRAALPSLLSLKHHFHLRFPEP
jgi:hypothetical protein